MEGQTEAQRQLIPTLASIARAKFNLQLSLAIPTQQKEKTKIDGLRHHSTMINNTRSVHRDHHINTIYVK